MIVSSWLGSQDFSARELAEAHRLSTRSCRAPIIRGRPGQDPTVRYWRNRARAPADRALLWSHAPGVASVPRSGIRDRTPGRGFGGGRGVGPRPMAVVAASPDPAVAGPG